MYPFHVITHRKLIQVLVCMMLIGLLLSIPYETYRTQQLRHDLHTAMMQLALKEHTYYVEHYTYTADISALNKIIHDLPYDLSLEKNMDYHHDFVIIAQYKYQKKIQDEEVLCPYITLNQAGRWCVRGHCAAQCWTE